MWTMQSVVISRQSMSASVNKDSREMDRLNAEVSYNQNNWMISPGERSESFLIDNTDASILWLRTNGFKLISMGGN